MEENQITGASERLKLSQKRQHPPGEEVRRVSLWLASDREEEERWPIRQNLGGGVVLPKSRRVP